MSMVIPQKVDRNANTPERVLRALQQIGSLIDKPIVSCNVSAADESANIRAITLRVRDRGNTNLAGRWMVMVFVSLSSGGAPSSTPTFGTATAGTLIADLSVTSGENVRVYESNAAGTITVPVTYASTGNIYVRSMVLGLVDESSAIAYT